MKALHLSTQSVRLCWHRVRLRYQHDVWRIDCGIWNSADVMVVPKWLRARALQLQPFAMANDHLCLQVSSMG